MHFGLVPFGFIDYVIIPFGFIRFGLCVMSCTVSQYLKFSHGTIDSFDVSIIKIHTKC